MFDKGFDEPSYDMGGYDDYGTEYESDGQDKKKLIKYGIIGIVILAIVIFAVSYINSQQTVNFTLRAKDGPILSGEQLTIYDSSRNPIYSERATEHVYTLGPGTYTYRVNALGYKTKNGTLTISEGGTKEENVILYKDIDTEIEVNLSTDKIYQGQTVSGSILITNTGNSIIQNEKIIAESDFFDIISLTPENISISAGGTKGADFEIKIKEDVEDFEEEQLETLEFRIKGTSDTGEIKIPSFPALGVNEVDFSEDNIEESVTAGKSEIIDEYTIENKNRDGIPLENVLVEIEASPGFESEISWFTISDYTGQRNTKLIDRINSREEANFQIILNPPFSQEIDDEFRGILKISSLSMEEDIRVPLNIIIGDKEEAELVLDIEDYSSKCVVGVGCEEIVTIGSDASTISNDGDVTIENINLSLIDGGKASEYCTFWITLNETNITKLESGEEKVIAWDIEVDDTSDKETHTCYLEYSYDDPFNIGQTIIGESDPFAIEVTVEEADE
jgi:hypothetical protein